jgi:hypothetical protein
MAGRPLKTSLAWHSAYWCAPHGAMPSLPSPCPHYRLRAWQMIKRKGASSSNKKLTIAELVIKKGVYVTSLSHVGTSWFEVCCSNKNKLEEFNGDVIDGLASMTDADRAKSMLPHAMAYPTLIEAISNALQNGTFPYDMIGKGGTYGPPYPPAEDIDPIHLDLLGELGTTPPVVRPVARYSTA